MTLEELTQCNGQNGQPAYVAVAGTIYDVSNSPLWKNGNHEGSHHAGFDLTEELKTAPHVAAVVERYPAVDRLETTPESTRSGGTKIVIIAILIVALILTIFLLR